MTTKKPAKKKAAATPTPAKNNRVSVRNPDNAASWRERQEEKGYRFVQFWARPVVAAKLDRLVADRLAVDAQTKVKPKDVIEDLILAAP